MRIGELQWLTTRDVYPDKGVVLVQDKQVPETDESWHVLKHGDERAIPLCPAARAIATRALAETNGPWLFPAPEGKRWKYGRLGEALDKAIRLSTLDI